MYSYFLFLLLFTVFANPFYCIIRLYLFVVFIKGGSIQKKASGSHGENLFNKLSKVNSWGGLPGHSKIM